MLAGFVLPSTNPNKEPRYTLANLAGLQYSLAEFANDAGIQGLYDNDSHLTNLLRCCGQVSEYPTARSEKVRRTRRFGGRTLCTVELEAAVLAQATGAPVKMLAVRSPKKGERIFVPR